MRDRLTKTDRWRNKEERERKSNGEGEREGGREVAKTFVWKRLF